jgi:hypothetical protein
MCSLVPAGTRVDIWQDLGVVDAMAVIELEAKYYVNLMRFLFCLNCPESLILLRSMAVVATTWPPRDASQGKIV